MFVFPFFLGFQKATSHHEKDSKCLCCAGLMFLASVKAIFFITIHYLQKISYALWLFNKVKRDTHFYFIIELDQSTCFKTTVYSNVRLRGCLKQRFV